MASLVDKYFSKADFDAISSAVVAAEHRTSGELAIKLASHTREWLTERLIYSSVLAILCLSVALVLTREQNWGLYYNFSQALIGGIIGFAVGFFVLPLWLQNETRRRQAVWNRAVFEFSRLTPTKGHTGVLILVSMEERQAAIVADRKIAEKLPPDYWDKPHAMIMEGIGKSEHAEGIIAALDEIGKRMAEFFPRADDDVNEIPDRPEVIK